jgi:hypothetical protein
MKTLHNIAVILVCSFCSNNAYRVVVLEKDVGMTGVEVIYNVFS